MPPPKIIAFISRKGGTGKTTNAINLATSLFEAGKKLVLIETDANYTLSTLRKLELFKAKTNTACFDILGSTDENVSDELSGWKENKKLDYVVVDSAGKTTNEGIKKLCLASDVVIVPTSLTPNDLLVTYQTITDLSPAQQHNPRLKILILPNRLHSGTGLHTVRDNLKNVNALVLPVIVPQRNKFVNFSTLRAEKDYQPVFRELLKHMA